MLTFMPRLYTPFADLIQLNIRTTYLAELFGHVKSIRRESSKI